MQEICDGLPLRRTKQPLGSSRELRITHYVDWLF